MNLALTEDQAMIREAAQSYLADASDSAAVRKAIDSEQGFDSSVWQTISGELGWCGVAIDEAYGGLGLSVTELAYIQEQAGYRLLCSPFFSTVCMAANLLQAVGHDQVKAEYLPQIAAGDLCATVPISSAADAWQSTEISAKEKNGEWLLSGKLDRVPDAGAADLLFVFANTEAGSGLFAVSTAAQGIKTTALETWDATRRFACVELSNTPAAMRCDEPSAIDQGRQQAAAVARLLIAAEQLGAAQRCLDLTVEYTAERKQFGRVIAGFQAVKHRCAQMMVQVEALRSAVYGAAAVVTDNGDVETVSMECAMAKALASDTLFFCAGEAIQLHGGVGFTWEYDPQLYFKRAQASKHWMGGPPALRALIASSVLGAEV